MPLTLFLLQNIPTASLSGYFVVYVIDFCIQHRTFFTSQIVLAQLQMLQ